MCDIKYIKENVLGHWCGCLSESKTLGKVGIWSLHSKCNCRKQWRERKNLGNEEVMQGIQISICNFPEEQCGIILGESCLFYMQFFISNASNYNWGMQVFMLFYKQLFYFHITRWVGYVAISKPIVFCIAKDRIIL